jgi:hypothetical protein
MNLELLAAVEREILGWPGVEAEQAWFGGAEVTIYKVGRRQLGHVHDDGVADLLFPKAVHDELISAGRAEPHGAGFAGAVSAALERPDEVPEVVALFRVSYERARAAIEHRGADLVERDAS